VNAVLRAGRRLLPPVRHLARRHSTSWTPSPS
jgi:hypothetical protein